MRLLKLAYEITVDTDSDRCSKNDSIGHQNTESVTNFCHRHRFKLKPSTLKTNLSAFQPTSEVLRNLIKYSVHDSRIVQLNWRIIRNVRFRISQVRSLSWEPELFLSCNKICSNIETIWNTLFFYFIMIKCKNLDRQETKSDWNIQAIGWNCMFEKFSFRNSIPLS